MSDEKHKPWCSEQARKINGGCICKAESSFAAPTLLACCWSENSNGAWATGCGNLYEVNDGTPLENKMHFCCFCGRKLTESRYVDDIRDDHDDEYVAELAAKQANAELRHSADNAASKPNKTTNEH